MKEGMYGELKREISIKNRILSPQNRDFSKVPIAG